MSENALGHLGAGDRPTLYDTGDLTADYTPAPLSADPRQPATDCEACATKGEPVNVITGYGWSTGVDLAAAARGTSLAVSRTYNSYDGLARIDGPFGYGWSWSYGARALVRTDDSVTIIEPTGRRAHFWKTPAGWSAAVNVTATLTAGTGGT